MSHYTDIMLGIGTIGGLLLGGGGIAVAKGFKKLDRIGEVWEQVAGKPAVLDRSGATVHEAVPGLPAQVADIRLLAERAIGGNDEIIRRQDRASTDHQKLAERVGRIETKVGQTLSVVTNQ